MYVLLRARDNEYHHRLLLCIVLVYRRNASAQCDSFDFSIRFSFTLFIECAMAYVN